ncbi:PKD domain-containing protein [Patescibacteria group bacterium]|nr:MAG: PKD domain-containing protein [Patescibacteria group bacterium]
MKKLLPVLFLLPLPLSAQVVISEIMYDLSGTDTDREWVEVQNQGSSAVDLSQWRFFEGNTNHTLNIVQGNATLGAGEYAVIADNSAKFLLDWPNFSGILFDSSFSLGNTGETLVLRDEAGTDRDTISYSSSLGAAGDGNSLHRSGGNLTAGTPTPGQGASAGASAGGTQSSSGSGQTQTSSSSSDSSSQTQTSQAATSESEQTDSFVVDAGKDRLTAVGSVVILRGEIKSSQRTRGGVFTWSLGDGSIKYGQEVSYNYRYPGDYVAVLNVSNGDERATDRVNIKVVEPELAVSVLSSGLLEIRNLSSHEINLQEWKLLADGKTFVFPRDTILVGKGKLTLGSEVTGFALVPGSVVKIFYPLGAEYAYRVTQAAEPKVKEEDSVRQELAADSKQKTAKKDSDNAELVSQAPQLSEVEPQEDQTAAAANVYVVERPKGFWSKIIAFFKSIFR